MPVPESATRAPNQKAPPDPALIAAWRRLLDFDSKSTSEKTDYQNIRMLVLWLSFLSSALAVVSAYQVSTLLSDLLRVALVMMPIASVALMNFAREYATSTDWIEYRVSAEMIRTQIYLYRMKLGDYMGKSDYERQKLMLDKIEEADEKIAQANITSPYLKTTDEGILAKIQAAGRAGDDGMSPLSVDTYVDKRIVDQLGWYIRKIQRDYRSSQRYRIAVLVVSGAGSFLALLGYRWEALVAVTSALATFLAQRSEMQLYGATYNIYHKAASQLQVELNQWRIMTPDMKKDQAKQSEFVMAIEGIFNQESNEWREQAIQRLKTNEQAILNNIQQIQQKVTTGEGEEPSEDGTLPATGTTVVGASTNGDATASGN